MDAICWILSTSERRRPGREPRLFLASGGAVLPRAAAMIGGLGLVERLPLNGAGKVDRTAVRDMAEALFGTLLGAQS